MKTALICGVSGQDGAYLAQLLLNKGYIVCGTSRDAEMSSFKNLVRLGIRDNVKLESMAITDFRSVVQLLTKFSRMKFTIWLGRVQLDCLLNNL